MSNPLLEMGNDLPYYSAIQPSHIEEAIDVFLDKAQLALDDAIKTDIAPTWENLIDPLDLVNQDLGRAWGVVNHLTSVLDSTELRAVHAKMLPKVTAFGSTYSQSLELFEKYKKIKSSSSWSSLTGAQQKVINNAIRDFQLGGAELDPSLKPKFASISEELANLTKSFSDR